MGKSLHPFNRSALTADKFFWGYSLAFAPASPFIGDLRHFGLMGVLDQPSPGGARIPAIVYAIYQCMFATVTVAIVIGATAERARIGPALIFAFVWATLVYDPIACWTWSPTGWANKLGELDFAGGGVVHISSYALARPLHREGPDDAQGEPPLSPIRYGSASARGSAPRRSTTSLRMSPFASSAPRSCGLDGASVHRKAVGALTVRLRFGFNAGSALDATFRSAQAASVAASESCCLADPLPRIVTNLSASVATLTWMLIDYRFEKKWSAVGACSGAISGLVAVTPASVCPLRRRWRRR